MRETFIARYNEVMKSYRAEDWEVRTYLYMMPDGSIEQRKHAV